MMSIARVGFLKLQGSQSGWPVVILEAGGGGDSESWEFVQECLARHTLTVSYDRSGLGQNSEWADDVGAVGVVSRLDAWLTEAHVQPPYVLVGHSLGGLFVQHYAAEYPGKTVGIVLVDSTGTVAIVSCDALAKGGWLDREPLSTATRELAAIEATQLLVRDRPVRPKVPVLAVSAGSPWPHEPTSPISAEQTRHAQDALIRHHREIAARSVCGRHAIMPNATHQSVVENSDHAAELAKHIWCFIEAIG